MFLAILVLTWLEAITAQQINHHLAPRSNISGISCCTQLKARLGSLISFPNSTLFVGEQTSSENGYFSTAEQHLTPACRVTPANTTDVSKVVKALSDLGCQFAIRGGGHMIWAGAANIQHGVTIDLGQMRNVDVSLNRKTVSAGPGCRWGDLYTTLDPLALAVVGGRVDTVGIAGLTIGGGNSWFASRYGFVCDNVQNFEVVLSSGAIINANASSNEDLYKALKGGGNNFGLVTRFDYTAFDQKGVWGGLVLFAPNTSIAQLQALEAFNVAQGTGQDEFAAIESIHAYNSSGPTTLGAIVVHTKPLANASVFDRFLKERPQLTNDLRFTNLSTLTVETEAPPGNWVWAHLSLPNNATTLAEVNDIMQEVFTDLPVKAKNYTFSNVYQPISSAITRKSDASGGNILGLDAEEAIVWDNFAVNFFNYDDYPIFNAATETYIDRVNIYMSSIEQLQRPLYMNYAYPTQPVIASYGGENVRFLRNVSNKFDPQGVFQKLVPGGFKLEV